MKSAVSYISDFEKELVALAVSKKADAIICGHIHQAADRWYGDIRYLNSGDWVESLTALVEEENGNWKIVHYQDWLNTLPEKKKQSAGESLSEILPQGVTVQLNR